MNIPREKSLYCPKCNTHTPHKVRQFKAGKARAMSVGTRSNVRKHKSGYKGKSKFTAIVKKQTKKPAYLAECTVCQRKIYWVIPKRMKKAELVAIA